MALVYEKHQKTHDASKILSEIVFNEEFTDLKNELTLFYQRYDCPGAEKEAFCDAIYCFLTETKAQALSM